MHVRTGYLRCCEASRNSDDTCCYTSNSDGAKFGIICFVYVVDANLSPGVPVVRLTAHIGVYG